MEITFRIPDKYSHLICQNLYKRKLISNLEYLGLTLAILFQIELSNTSFVFTPAILRELLLSPIGLCKLKVIYITPPIDTIAKQIRFKYEKRKVH